MKRDFAEIRRLLLVVEESNHRRGKQFFGKEPEMMAALGFETDPFPDAEEVTDFVEYQLRKMEEAGLVTIQAGQPTFVQMTFNGHDYLDAVRDEKIWQETMNAISTVGGSTTIEVVKAVAVGFVTTAIEKHTGVKL